MQPPIHFETPAAFRAWLRKHHGTARAVVLRVARNRAAATGVTYSQALDEALCYGWIDGVRSRLDADSFSVRFTPRRPRSIWSRVNVRHVERTGVYSFEQRPTGLPAPFRRRFRANKAAWAYFQQEAPWYRRTSSFWVLSAKREETRLRRLETLIACCASQTRLGPLRRP